MITEYQLGWLLIAMVMSLMAIYVLCLNSKVKAQQLDINRLYELNSEKRSLIDTQAGSIVALQTNLENLRQEMKLTHAADTSVTVDWDEVTKKVIAETDLPNTYVPPTTQELEAAVHRQYQQVKSSAEHLIDHRKMKAKDEANRLAAKYPHYYVNVEGLNVIDFYRIAQLYGITDPCIQHVVKKLLATGNRGHKNFRHDIEDSIDTLKARLRMLDEDGVE